MAEIVDAAKDALGMGGPKVRYAVVALGDISQRAFMPGVSHTHNSEVVALCTSDVRKAEELCKKYKINNSYSYEQFESMLRSKTIDAIYLATPNWRHAEFAIPALKAGIHVLLEKPMEINSALCQDIIDAQKASKAKLMVAYRLHFEPATIAAIERVRSGDLGQVHMFNSSFSQMCNPENHRAQNGEAAGPLFDMGVYPINACRNLFGAEPIEVFAFGTKHPGSGFSDDFCDTVSATLVFPENRLAQFTVSYYLNKVDEYVICGTKGSIRVEPAYMYKKGLEFDPLIEGEKESHEKFKHTDQFGGELQYFSECIQKDEDPEPNGEEGLCDVRVIESLIRSLQTKQPQRLAPFTRTQRISSSQVKKLRFIKPPPPSAEVNAQPPSK